MKKPIVFLLTLLSVLPLCAAGVAEFALTIGKEVEIDGVAARHIIK